MRATDNKEPVAGDVIRVEHKENNQNANGSLQGDLNCKQVLLQPVSDVSQHANMEMDSNKLPSVSGSGTVLQSAPQNVVFVPQNIPERVVYVSNHNPGGDPRVVNVLQGREFFEATNVEGEIHKPNIIQEPVKHMQNTISGPVVYVQTKVPEENVSAQSNSGNNQQTYSSESAHGRVVYVQHNAAEGNTNTPNTAMDPHSLGPNNTEQSVLYMPNNIPDNNINMPANIVNMSASDPNQMPVRLVYLPQQMPDGNVNMQSSIPGVTIHAPNDMQNVQYNMASNIPPRTPSPVRTPSPNKNQERAMQVAQQVMTMAGKMMKNNNNGHNNNLERVVYVAQPMPQLMSSPYMMQVPYQGDFIPQMQYSNLYASQQMLHHGAMPQMYQPAFVPSSPHPVQDGVYMASPPDGSSFMPQESIISQNLPDISQPMGSTSAFDNVTDFVNPDMDDDSCCSWFDCCSSIFVCCSD